MSKADNSRYYTYQCSYVNTETQKWSGDGTCLFTRVAKRPGPALIWASCWDLMRYTAELPPQAESGYRGQKVSRVQATIASGHCQLTSDAAVDLGRGAALTGRDEPPISLFGLLF